MELLLIDDEEYIGPLVEELMRIDDPNVHVQQVLDCNAGLEQLKQRRFDCLILDHGLSRQSGLECLNFIRSMYPELPVVVLTGEMNDDLKVEYERAGADKYVIKPFISQLFGPVVKAAIEQRQKLCDAFAKRDRMLTALKNVI